MYECIFKQENLYIIIKMLLIIKYLINNLIIKKKII